MTKDEVLKMLEEKLATEQKKVDSLLLDLGRAYYDRTTDETGDFSTYKLSTERSRVAHCHQRIAILQHSINEVKNCNHAAKVTAG